MHTIDICPRCGTDFIYHSSETNLTRVLAYDADSKEPCSFEIICQDCDEIENIAQFIKEVADHRGWENAEYIATNKFGEDKILKAIQYLNRNNVN